MPPPVGRAIATSFRRQNLSPLVTLSRTDTDTDAEGGRDRARTLALAAAKVAEETRGTDVRVLDLRSLTEVFDYFVVATGSSRRQLHAMADEIERILHRDLHDAKRGGEGYEEGRWIVLDYGDVVVHLFDPEARGYWDLEHLWSDARPVPLPTVSSGVATG
jgi:ribosome-associated protein